MNERGKRGRKGKREHIMYAKVVSNLVDTLKVADLCEEKKGVCKYECLPFLESFLI